MVEVEKFNHSGNENRFSLDTRNIRKGTGVGGGEVKVRRLVFMQLAG